MILNVVAPPAGRSRGHVAREQAGERGEGDHGSALQGQVAAEHTPMPVDFWWDFESCYGNISCGFWLGPMARVSG